MKVQADKQIRIPSQSRLYSEYLKQKQELRRFYPNLNALGGEFPPVGTVSDVSALQRYKTVAGILERQNRTFGAGDETFRNIEKLKQGAVAVVTGQQAILFGGPLFTILKAISVIKVAKKMTAEGNPVVPIFWVATSDHDLGEVSIANILDTSGRFTRIEHLPSATENAPVSDVKLGEEVRGALAVVREHLGGEAVDLLERCYTPDATFGDAFARMFASLFAKHGLIMLDPSDPEFNRLAAPIYRETIVRSGELNEALQARSRELETAGYHAQVLVEQDSGLLFHLQKGGRWPVQLQNGGFKIERKSWTREELLGLFETAPEKFNGNALLRPVVQDFLLPTVAYIGGPAEVAYFAQSAALYEKLLGRVTPILPRISTTLIEPNVDRQLNKYHLTLSDTWVRENELQADIAKKRLPQALMDTFQSSEAKLQDLLAPLQQGLNQLDVTLAEAAETASRKMNHQITKLRSRAAAAQGRKETDIAQHVQVLHDALYPKNQLQEREIAGIYFLARHGLGMIQDLERELLWEPGVHQTIHL